MSPPPALVARRRTVSSRGICFSRTPRRRKSPTLRATRTSFSTRRARRHNAPVRRATRPAPTTPIPTRLAAPQPTPRSPTAALSLSRSAAAVARRVNDGIESPRPRRAAVSGEDAAAACRRRSASSRVSSLGEAMARKRDSADQANVGGSANEPDFGDSEVCLHIIEMLSDCRNWFCVGRVLLIAKR